jgi:hypothetical protein
MIRKRMMGLFCESAVHDMCAVRCIMQEEQMAAFIHHNGPVSAGINANVFGLREKGCEKTGGAYIL